MPDRDRMGSESRSDMNESRSQKSPARDTGSDQHSDRSRERSQKDKGKSQDSMKLNPARDRE